MLGWIISAVLAVVCFLLGMKIYLLRKSCSEITEKLDMIMSCDTNNLITISSKDKEMRRLADGLNRRLKELRREQLRYINGDRELKDAVKVPNLKKGTSIPEETPLPTPEPEYSASKAPDLGGRRLRSRSEGPEVFWVQTRLAELGYYTGYAGGKMLDGTVKAVKAYQRDQKIYASGEVDQKLIDLMAAPPEVEETVNLDESPAPETAGAGTETPAQTAPSPTPGPGKV